jgi:hypothetical protein
MNGLLFLARAFFLFVVLVSFVQAKGRSPDDDGKDPFPDYNRLEFQHTAPPPETPSKAAPDSNVPAVPAPGTKSPITPSTPVPAAPLPFVSPVLHSTETAPGEDLSHPRPPPAALPNNDPSEPDLPGARLHRRPDIAPLRA